MDPQAVSPGDGAIDEQMLGLLQHHRRLTFLTLAESLPLYTWHALFAALNRFRGQHHVDLLPLAADYEVVWQQGSERPSLMSEGPSGCDGDVAMDTTARRVRVIEGGKGCPAVDVGV